MARPTIDHLLDHTVRVWRAVVTKDRLGAESRNYEVVGTIPAALNRSTAPVAQTGSGLAPTGRMRLYMKPTANVRTRDVLELRSGPMFNPDGDPYVWEVDEPPTKPRNHHTQVDAIFWNGTLPESAS